MRYRFDMCSAQDAGFLEHPQITIARFFSDAGNFEPVTIADCWLFEADEKNNLPDFIIPIKDLS